MPEQQKMPQPVFIAGGQVPQRLMRPPQAPGGSALSPADVLAIIQRRKWYLILPAAVIITIAVVVALVLPPFYRSTATILIEDQAIPPDFVMTTVTSYAESRLQTINQRIMSSSRLLEIIKEFNLYSSEREERTTDELIDRMRENVKLEPISADIKDPRTGRATTATIAFTLSFEGSESPKRIQDVTSRLVSLFLEENLKVRQRQVKETSQFLENEAELLRQRINQIESKIAAFKSKNINQLPELLPTNVGSLAQIEDQIQNYRDRLDILERTRSQLQSQIAVTPKGWDRNWVSEKSPDIQRLEALEVRLVEYQSRYTDKHPDIARTRQEIDDLRKQLDLPPYPEPISKKADGRPENPAYINLQTQLSGVNMEIQTLQTRLTDLEATADQYRRRIETTPRVEEEYNLLLADRANTQAKYNDLLQKAMEARMAQGLETEQKGERFTLIDPARRPQKPFKPNRLAIMLVGVVLGIGAGVGLGVLREVTDTSLQNPEMLSRLTGHPVLAGVPLFINASDARTKRRKRTIMIAIVAILVVATPILFHFFVMDLDILFSKVGRRLGLL